MMALTITAQGGVIDASSRGRLAAESLAAAASAPAQGRATVYQPMILRVTDAEGMEALEKAEALIWGQRGEIVVACVPRSNLTIIDNAGGIATAATATALTPQMDIARSEAGADALTTAFTMPYDGTGVVAGFCDTGFDARHIMFDGRVGMMSVYNETGGERTFLTTAYEISSLRTDNAAECHATHVAGIMAGDYTANGYQGIARGATIAATGSRLTDIGVLAGMEDILAYAKERSMPTVINVSLANYTGPHDGTSLFNQYLADLAQEAIVVMSAGNNGDAPYSLHATFGPDSELTTSIMTWTGFHPSGIVDIWSDTAEPLTVALGIWDTDTGRLLLRTPATGTGARSSWVMTSTPDAFSFSDRMVADYKAFSELFSGFITVDGEVNSENSRYHLALNFDYTTEPRAASGNWARYRIMLFVNGSEGHRCDIFTEGLTTRLQASGYPRALNGDSSMSISDMACGEGIISVGMSVTRNSFPTIDGDDFTSDWKVGRISPYSSYGTTPGGRVMPDITAPGGYIVSALSGAYLDQHPDGGDFKVAAQVTTPDGGRHAWTGMSGTSMSSPLVAGCVAAWLQAIPDLTAAEALEAMQHTARTDMADAGDPRYGSSGMLNAEAALRHLLDRRAGIESAVGTQEPGFTYNPAIRTITAANSGARMELWTPAGARAASAVGTMRLHSGLRGVFILTGASTLPARIVVK